MVNGRYRTNEGLGWAHRLSDDLEFCFLTNVRPKWQNKINLLKLKKATEKLLIVEMSVYYISTIGDVKLEITTQMD